MRVYAFVLGIIALCTLVGLALRGYLDPTNLAMLYLLAVVLVASRYGRGASALTAILAALSFDFFLVEPYYSFVISDIQYVITFVGLLITGLLISAKTSQLVTQSAYFKTKEQNTAALYAVAHELVSTRGQDNMLQVIRRHVEESFDGIATLWMPSHDSQLSRVIPSDSPDDLKEKSAAIFAYEHGQSTGLGTLTPTGAKGYYIPLKGLEKILGVLGFLPHDANALRADEKARLEAFASVATSALERVNVAELAEQHKIEAEGEKLRNTLLSSVSHDFRTPLASIKGVISSLMLEDDRLGHEDKKELLASAHGEVVRLERIVSNLLEVTLLESGKLKLKKDYYFLPELVGNALKQSESALKSRQVTCNIQPDMPTLYVDGLLIEQVLVNLMENAAKYTPDGSSIHLHCDSYGGQVKIVIEDTGSGIPAGEEEKIFDSFYTAAQTTRKGSGLGLAICRGILQAHGGSIKAENRPQGGAVFTITLPVSIVPNVEEAA